MVITLLAKKRARYYNPGTGTFVSEDPIGFGGEDTNLYRYVGNNPQSFTDPSGENKSLLIVFVGAATEAFNFLTPICLEIPSCRKALDDFAKKIAPKKPEAETPKEETPQPGCDSTKQSCEVEIDPEDFKDPRRCPA